MAVALPNSSTRSVPRVIKRAFRKTLVRTVLRRAVVAPSLQRHSLVSRARSQTLAVQSETLLVARGPGHSILGDLRDGARAFSPPDGRYPRPVAHPVCPASSRPPGRTPQAPARG